MMSNDRLLADPLVKNVFNHLAEQHSAHHTRSDAKCHLCSSAHPAAATVAVASVSATVPATVPATVSTAISTVPMVAVVVAR